MYAWIVIFGVVNAFILQCLAVCTTVQAVGKSSPQTHEIAGCQSVPFVCFLTCQFSDYVHILFAHSPNFCYIIFANKVSMISVYDWRRRRRTKNPLKKKGEQESGTNKCSENCFSHLDLLVKTVVTRAIDKGVFMHGILLPATAFIYRSHLCVSSMDCIYFRR